jgi:hypothetical protein
MCGCNISMPRAINLFGLVVSLIAAGLMFFFPLYTAPIIQDKTTPKTPLVFVGGGKVSRWKVCLAKLGPILLGIGFLSQIIAALMSGNSIARTKTRPEWRAVASGLGIATDASNDYDPGRRHGGRTCC